VRPAVGFGDIQVDEQRGDRVLSKNSIGRLWRLLGC
jgi:hypothetical protein